MSATEAIPYYEPGARITARASGGDVIAKRVVQITQGWGNGDVIGVMHCSTPDKGIAVAVQNALDGEITSVVMDGIVPLTASEDIVAGQEVGVTADGQIGSPAAAGEELGVALSSTTVSGGDVMVRLRL
jgi:hypothetical protein